MLPLPSFRAATALAIVLTATQAVVPAFAAAPYCLPGDACFPGSAELDAFNATVNGALLKSVPYGMPCYGAAYNAAECKLLAEIKGNEDWRRNLSAGMMYPNWEQDGLLGDKGGCLVPNPNPDGTPPGPVSGECSLGGLPSYMVKAASADDIAKSVIFAEKHNLRLRVKNTGHDYLGRSTDAGAFSIWTRHMNDARLVRGFVPDGCSAPPQDVISAGPGIDAAELYRAAAEVGKVVIGASASSVGVTGGFLLGGGVGPLSPHLGMAVDNLVQAEVVTSDGKMLVVNACNQPDLFWALRGGGGAFAAVTRAYIKAHPAFSAINSVAGQIGCANRASYEGLVRTIVDAQTSLQENGHTGVWACQPSRLGCMYISVVSFGSNDTVFPASETLDDLQSILTVSGCANSLRATTFTGSRSWNEAYQGVISPMVSASVSVGLPVTVHSRIVPRPLIESPEGLERIKGFLLDLPSASSFIWQNTVSGAVTQVEPNTTSVHPAWRNAFNFINIAVPGTWSGLTQQVIDTGRAIVANATAVFGTAAYYNEDFVLEENWQDSFFGTNYPRLLEIKRRVDPSRVFNCRLCVGSEDGF
ncbi:hypothetical protein GGTG_05774 [Gaeumannomyces tritici R3-111a-1]|uniref:FAD-binding PCMH-type domain-containing protein n=1 Tax=Gaeumannomyces tritici (strain R3-111a-1) TaxID=644352 RepID=J3NWW3_GAET3|nr:hypothetical protein GGTG_05774 [Gaeumannomyces tritici R3-111a-1]EJT75845.1 hypothetical protein GGTG_05774 [Gaeumannomyces tritici R3-111a-1]